MRQGPTPVRIVAAILAALSLAVPFVGENEGRPAKTYVDSGGVVTGGYGHTGPDVTKAGVPVSDAQATRWLADDLMKHGLEMARPGCVDPNMLVSLSPLTLSALQDFSYNVGITAFCRSTLVKKLNAGDTRGACAEMSRWAYDNGKFVYGLELRRKRERARCEAGLI